MKKAKEELLCLSPYERAKIHQNKVFPGAKASKRKTRAVSPIRGIEASEGMQGMEEKVPFSTDIILTIYSV